MTSPHLFPWETCDQATLIAQLERGKREGKARAMQLLAAAGVSAKDLGAKARAAFGLESTDDDDDEINQGDVNHASQRTRTPQAAAGQAQAVPD